MQYQIHKLFFLFLNMIFFNFKKKKWIIFFNFNENGFGVKATCGDKLHLQFSTDESQQTLFPSNQL